MMSRNARAFSLIEVLIGIVVLALGLVGLAAVFPVVVTQQRSVSDTIQGGSVDNSIQEYLVQHLRLNNDSDRNGNGTIEATERSGWHRLTSVATWSQEQQWVLPTIGDISGTTVGLGLNAQTGAMAIGDQSAGGVAIPVSERLIPRPYSTDASPRYVWDMVARRVFRPGQTAPTTKDIVQIAVFVRRIDASIRVAAGRTVSDAIMNPVVNGERRVPVASDEQGRPTYDGLGRGANTPNYSTIGTFPFTLRDEGSGVILNQIIPDDSGQPEVMPLVNQIGQKFVSDDGGVHTVTDFVRNPNSNNEIVALVIEPGVSRRVADRAGAGTAKMLFTPQIPAAVSTKFIRQ